jgi:hypothetical protein
MRDLQEAIYDTMYNTIFDAWYGTRSLKGYMVRSSRSLMVEWRTRICRRLLPIEHPIARPTSHTPGVDQLYLLEQNTKLGPRESESEHAENREAAALKLGLGTFAAVKLPVTPRCGLKSGRSGQTLMSSTARNGRETRDRSGIRECDLQL